jgi:predicted DCC family thiol-disulfide oxidoreductase YuxK
MTRAALIAVRASREPYSYRLDDRVPQFSDAWPIIVFDGHCGFCSAWVQFVLRHDRGGKYRFIAGQSKLGQALYAHYGLDPVNFETNILIENGRAYFKADGSIRMFVGLGAPWSWVRLLRIIPNGLLEPAYELVARNRMRLLGRRDVCFAPSQQFKDRFLS